MSEEENKSVPEFDYSQHHRFIEKWCAEYVEGCMNEWVEDARIAASHGGNHDEDETYDWLTANPDDDDFIRAANDHGMEAQLRDGFWYIVEVAGEAIDFHFGGETNDLDGAFASEGEAAREYVDLFDIEHEVESQSEVFQHFAVKDRLAYWLEHVGEKVVRINGWMVWCRTCCGQSYTLDCAMQRAYVASGDWADDWRRYQVVKDAEDRVQSGDCVDRLLLHTIIKELKRTGGTI